MIKRDRHIEEDNMKENDIENDISVNLDSLLRMN